MPFLPPSTPFHVDPRTPYLDESGLTPEEFAVYMPALMSLKEAPSGVDGLFDEQDALRFLRQECGIELRDEAMVSSHSALTKCAGSLTCGNDSRSCHCSKGPHLASSQVISLRGCGSLRGHSKAKYRARGSFSRRVSC